MDKETLIANLNKNKHEINKFLITSTSNYWIGFNSCKILITIPTMNRLFQQYLDTSFSEISDLMPAVYKDWPIYKILADPYTKSMAILLKFSLELKLYDIARGLYTLLNIRMHYSLIKKYFKYCDAGAYQLALENLPKQHLFNQKESIQQSFYYLTDVLFERYKGLVPKDKTSTAMYRMIYDFRTRWEQSMKALARKFYDIKSGKIKIVSLQDREFLIDTRIDQMVDNTINNFLIYKKYDANVLKNVCNKVAFRPTYVEPFIKETMHISEDVLKPLLYIIINNSSSDDFIKTDFFISLLKRMSTRYTIDKKSLKEKIEEFIQRLMKQNSELARLYIKISSPYKQKIRICLALFLYYTMCNSLR
ncbi:hypothetical protein M0R19_07645 [Candidatus Pacearchaeota archaeon]|nr:hypothetical protein [bacterium]MCK9597032.1 hypothetical protein [Candidatus Pacearchaeota archaeon]